MKHVFFPSQWIKPGEFRYCGRCGLGASCTWGNTGQPCLECESNLSRCDSIEEWEFQLRLQTARKLAAIYEALRTEIAQKRRDAGLPPVFWMLPDYEVMYREKMVAYLAILDAAKSDRSNKLLELLKSDLDSMAIAVQVNDKFIHIEEFNGVWREKPAREKL